MSWACVWRFHEFSPQASSFVRSTAVCSTPLRRELVLQLNDRYDIVSAVIVLQSATQLEVVCLL